MPPSAAAIWSLAAAEVSRASAKLSMEQSYLELRFALGFGPLDDEEAR